MEHWSKAEDRTSLYQQILMIIDYWGVQEDVKYFTNNSFKRDHLWPGTLAHLYNPSTGEVEARGSQVEINLEYILVHLYLDYVPRPCLK